MAVADKCLFLISLQGRRFFVRLEACWKFGQSTVRASSGHLQWRDGQLWLHGYPFLEKMSLKLFSSISMVDVEQIFKALEVSDLTRPTFWLVGTKESHLVYSPVKVGFR